MRAGGVIALPTETVYGLAADAENDEAVARIYAIKGRPPTHPVIVHLASASALPGWTTETGIDALAPLAARFWPGPLTAIVPRGPRASDRVTAGHDTVALRVPAHPIAQAILHAFGGAVAAPSANRFGEVSPTRAAHVERDLGALVDLVVDGGDTPVGLESTIVDLAHGAPRILRPGAIGREELSAALGTAVVANAAGATSEVAAPGTLAAHYAPRARVQLVEAAERDEAQRRLRASGEQYVVLADDDPQRYARELYARLRAADDAGASVVLAVLPPAQGIGIAVRDRLMRASAPREDASAAGNDTP